MTNRQNKIYPLCALCGQVPSGGLHDGLRIMGKFICSDCESTLCTLECDDPRYHHFAALLKDAFWSSANDVRRFTQV